MTNTKELKSKIHDSGFKISFLADKCGLSRNGLSLKINGKYEFNAVEIKTLKELLDLTPEEVDYLFLN